MQMRVRWVAAGAARLCTMSQSGAIKTEAQEMSELCTAACARILTQKLCREDAGAQSTVVGGEQWRGRDAHMTRPARRAASPMQAFLRRHSS